VCEPVSGTLGVLSAVSGAASAVGQYQSARAQTAAKNRAIANKANQRNRQYELETLQGVAEYNQAKVDVALKQQEVGLEYSRTASEEQLKTDDEINQYILADQDLAIKLLASEATDEGGRSRSRGATVRRALGRQRGANAANLIRQRTASKIRLDDARRRAGAQRQSLFASVANPYTPGPAPSQDIEFVKGPSPLGLIGGLAGAAVSGATTYNKFAPETKRIGYVAPPSPPSTPPN
jgi:hypothetical protein